MAHIVFYEFFFSKRNFEAFRFDTEIILINFWLQNDPFRKQKMIEVVPNFFDYRKKISISFRLSFCFAPFVGRTLGSRLLKASLDQDGNSLLLQISAGFGRAHLRGLLQGRGAVVQVQDRGPGDFPGPRSKLSILGCDEVSRKRPKQLIVRFVVAPLGSLLTISSETKEKQI